MGLPIVTLGTMGVEMGEGEAITTVGAVGVMDDVSGSPVGTSTMQGSVDGPCRWVEEKHGSEDDVCWIGLLDRGEGGRCGRILGTGLRLRGSDFLSSNPLAQYHEGITDLEVGTSNRDVALVVRAACHGKGVDSSTRNIMDLFKTLPTLTDNVLGRSIRNNDRDEVAVDFPSIGNV